MGKCIVDLRACAESMQVGSLYPTTKRGTKRNLSLKKLVETEKRGIGLSDGYQWTLIFQPFYGEA
jgi:hypothetical protein